MTHQMNDRMQECIDRCQSCQEACLEAISHCLEKGGRRGGPHPNADGVRRDLRHERPIHAARIPPSCAYVRGLR
jgi:hypothetical protein